MDLLTAWPRSAVATVAAAALAAIVALVSTVMAMIEASVSRRRAARRASRDEWWTRWSFTLDRALSSDPGERRVGALLLRLLVEIPRATEEDELMANAISEAVQQTSAAESRNEEAFDAASTRPPGNDPPDAGGT